MRACVHPSAVTLPEKHTTPMVMVALGTGIAPMRAFIEERAAAKQDGEACGPMALFFGARNRQEYSYEAEFVPWSLNLREKRDVRSSTRRMACWSTSI